MSIAQTAERLAKEAGNDVKVAFTFSFKIYSTSDLTVYKVAADGTYTLQVITTDYTVTIDAGAESGTVTYTTAPVSSGFSVIIGNTLPRTQETGFPRGTVTPNETYRDAYDKLTVLVQQLQDAVDRCVKTPLTPVNADTIDVDPPNVRRAAIFQDNGDNTWTIIPSTYDPDALVEAATVLNQVYTEGLFAARPSAPIVRHLYYATDIDQHFYYNPTAARWFNAFG